MLNGTVERKVKVSSTNFKERSEVELGENSSAVTGKSSGGIPRKYPLKSKSKSKLQTEKEDTKVQDEVKVNPSSVTMTKERENDVNEVDVNQLGMDVEKINLQGLSAAKPTDLLTPPMIDVPAPVEPPFSLSGIESRLDAFPKGSAPSSMSPQAVNVSGLTDNAVEHLSEDFKLNPNTLNREDHFVVEQSSDTNEEEVSTPIAPKFNRNDMVETPLNMEKGNEDMSTKAYNFASRNSSDSDSSFDENDMSHLM